MQIPKGTIEKWNNKTSARLLDKVFGPATEADIIEWIGTLYEQGILGGEGKSDTSSLNTVNTVPQHRK